ncbi:MAG: hypothetical protein IIB95_14215 [Candidatus Marinimicrobia bacterium]|nr:hypothetical protein [Candidatus Neomarinimicrobiota bacterium]
MEKAIVKIINGKYNVKSIANEIASEMKEHGIDIDDFDDYWRDVGQQLAKVVFLNSYLL